MNYSRIVLYISFLILILMISSCETGDSTAYDEKPVLFCYAAADSTLDSLYLSRTGGVNEPIDFNYLAVSGASVSLFEMPPDSSYFSKIGDLREYTEKNGIYYLDEIGFLEGFKPGYTYRIEVSHPDFESISAETVCPPQLEGIRATNNESGVEMSPNIVDTIFYRRGESYNDINLISCAFDSIAIMDQDRIAGYKIVPDEICRLDTSLWLEDTTSTVWEDYDFTMRIFKSQKNYGRNITDHFLRSMDIYWHRFYHEGMHTLIFFSTDQTYRSYLETRYGQDEIYSNVTNGYGLFTISNASSDRGRYRVFVKSLENKYP